MDAAGPSRLTTTSRLLGEVCTSGRDYVAIVAQKANRILEAGLDGARTSLSPKRLVD